MIYLYNWLIFFEKCDLCQIYSSYLQPILHLALRSFRIISSIVLCIGMMTSCVDKISLPETVEPAKIIVECELSPPFHIKAKLSTTGDLNGNYIPYFPEDAQLRLYSEIDEEFIFKYNSEKKLYEVTNGKLVSGRSYSLTGKLVDEEITPIFAATSIPGRIKIDSLEVMSSLEANSDQPNQSKKASTTIKIYLGEKAKSSFFHLTLNYKTARSLVDRIEYQPGLMPVNVDKIEVGGAAVHRLYHKEGLFIDASRLEENSITLTTSNSDLNVDEFIKSIYTDLKVVTESYYKYHINLSKQLKAEGNSIIEPVIDYTNIENGHGFFGSFVASKDSFLVR